MDAVRMITSHKSNAVNEAIDISADPRDAENGNASHEYKLYYIDQSEKACVQQLSFQHGPIGEVGVNGVTNEALLAIIIDRMQGFQSSKWSCRENAIVLTKLQEAMMWLQERTRERQNRGVEGTSQE